MILTFYHVSIKHKINFVASPGIEPGSGASEALILSIVLRGQRVLNIELMPKLYNITAEYFNCNSN